MERSPTSGTSGTNGAAHHVVIVGGGFGGLYAAKSLARAPVQITLLDKRNFHLFQPLLYQVATGGLSPANIAAPLRAILARQRNCRVLLGEAVGIDPEARKLKLRQGELSYDTLIAATGVCNQYYGNDHWEQLAPGLKTIEDATKIRRRVLLAFEEAERETHWPEIRAWLTFVIVGGGPTGVELAGALGEIANDTLKHNFRRINPADARILLIEPGERVLAEYPKALAQKAQQSLKLLGVSLMTGVRVTGIEQGDVVVWREDGHGAKEERIAARTVLWAAGVKGSPMGAMLSQSAGAEMDHMGRVLVEADLSIPGHPEILVLGDLACFLPQSGRPLPGTAPVAMQQARYAARLIRARLAGRTLQPFRYRHYGSMATIGRAAGVAEMGPIRLSGLTGWLAWLFVHLLYIVQFQNKILVLIQWAWNYFTRNRSSRLITNARDER